MEKEETSAHALCESEAPATLRHNSLGPICADLLSWIADKQGNRPTGLDGGRNINTFPQTHRALLALTNSKFPPKRSSHPLCCTLKHFTLPSPYLKALLWLQPTFPRRTSGQWPSTFTAVNSFSPPHNCHYVPLIIIIIIIILRHEFYVSKG